MDVKNLINEFREKTGKKSEAVSASPSVDVKSLIEDFRNAKSNSTLDMSESARNERAAQRRAEIGVKNLSSNVSDLNTRYTKYLSDYTSAASGYTSSDALTALKDTGDQLVADGDKLLAELSKYSLPEDTAKYVTDGIKNMQSVINTDYQKKYGVEKFNAAVEAGEVPALDEWDPTKNMSQANLSQITSAPKKTQTQSAVSLDKAIDELGKYWANWESDDAYQKDVRTFSYENKYGDMTYAELQQEKDKLAKKSAEDHLSEDALSTEGARSERFASKNGSSLPEEDKALLKEEIDWIDQYSKNRAVIDTMTADEIRKRIELNDAEAAQDVKRVENAQAALSARKEGLPADSEYEDDLDYIVKKYGIDTSGDMSQSIHEVYLKLIDEANDTVDTIAYYDEKDGTAMSWSNLLRLKTAGESIEKVEATPELASAYNELMSYNADIKRVENAQAALKAKNEGSPIAPYYTDLEYVVKKYGLDDSAGLEASLYDLYTRLIDESYGDMEEQKAILEKGGYSWDEFKAYHKWYADKQEAVERKKSYAIVANDYPVLAAITSILASPGQVFDYSGDLLSTAKNTGVGDDSMLGMPNAYDNHITSFVETVNSTVAENINKDVTDATGNKLVGWLASTAYSGGTSVLQSALTTTACIGLFGKGAGIYIARGLMSSQAAASSYASSVKNGSTNGEALLFSIASGVAEGISESIFPESENLLSLSRKYDVSSLKALMKSMAKDSGNLMIQGLQESGEEVFSEVASIVSDAIVNGDHSEYNNTVKQYVNDGYSKEQAEKLATQEYIANVLGAAIGGFVGGTAGGSLTTTTNAVRGTIGAIQYNAQKKRYNDATTFSTPKTVETDVDTEAQSGEAQSEVETVSSPSEDVSAERGDTDDAQLQRGEVQSNNSAPLQEDSTEQVEAVTSSYVTEEQGDTVEDTTPSTVTESQSHSSEVEVNEDAGASAQSEVRTVGEIDSMAELKEISKEGNTRVLAESEDSPVSITISRKNGKDWYTLNVNGVPQTTTIDIKSAVSYYNDAAFEYNADQMEIDAEDYIADDDFGYESDLKAKNYSSAEDVADDSGIQRSVANGQTTSTVTESRSPYPKGQVRVNMSLQERIAAMERTADAATVERARAESDLTVRSGILAGAGEENIRIARELGEAVGRRIVFYHDTTTVNGKMEHGYYAGGNILYVNAAAGNVVHSVVAHELTHSLEGTKAYGKLISFVDLKLKREGTSLDAMADEMMELYKQGGEELTPEGAQQEAVARFVEQRLLTDEASIKELANIRRSVAQRFLRFFDGILAKLNNKKATARLLEDIRSLYAEALGQSVSKISQEQSDNDVVRYSINDNNGEIAHLRDQIRAHQDELNTMDVVASVSGEGKTGRNKGEVKASAWEKAKRFGTEIVRENFGTVHFVKTKVKRSMGYKLTDAEVAAFDAVPSVIKDGVLIEGHKNHKDNGFPTVTIAAPVEVNGIRGNMGVVVAKSEVLNGSELRYKVYAVLLPNGTAFVYPANGNKNESEAGTHGTHDLRTADTPRRASDSNTSISDSAKKSNTYEEKSSAEESATRHQSSIGPAPGAENVQEQTAESKAEPVKVSELPPKAHNFYVIAVNKFVKDVTHQFGVPEFECGAYLRNAVEQLMQKHLDDGKTYGARTVFDEMYKGVVNRAFKHNELHRKVHELFKNSELLVPDEAVEELGKKNYKQSKWIKSDATEGAHPSEVYAKLTAISPDLFPAKIIAPMKQLERIYHIVPELESAVYTVNQALGKDPEYTKNLVYGDFEKTYDALQSSFKEIKRYSAEQVTKTVAKKKAPEPLQEDTVKYAYEQKRKARERINNIYNNALLSDADKAAVQRVLDGEITLDALNGDEVSLQNVKNLVEAVNDYRSISERLDEYNSKRLDKVIEQKKEQGGEFADRDAVIQYIKSFNKKAQGYLIGVRNRLLNDTKNIIGATRLGKRAKFKKIVNEMVIEYYATGTISEKSRSDLFEWTYDTAIIVNDEMYRQYSHIKKYLNTTKITLAETDRSDVGDYEFFRKKNIGTLALVNKGGLGVDSAYAELRKMAPELFPAQLTSPADQVMHMVQVARDLRKVEMSLDDFHGADAESKKAWSKNDFQVAMDALSSELQRVKRYADDKAKKEDFSDIKEITSKDIRDAYDKMKKPRRNYERVAAKHLLTAYDTVQVGRILKGEIKPADLDPQKVNSVGVMAVATAKAEYEVWSRFINDYKRKRKASNYAEADEHLKTAETFKDKRLGFLYSRETMERNIRDIVPNEQTAQGIIDTYFTPVHKAVAEANKLKERYRNRVRELELSQKIKKGNTVSESHAVQLYGEATDNMRAIKESHGEIEKRDDKTYEEWKAIVDKLKAENTHMDWVKIENAVKVFHEIYDELFELLNEVRVRNGYEPIDYRRGYFPHFQPDAKGLITAIGELFGINGDVTELPTAINGMTHTFTPGIQYFGPAHERLGFETEMDAVGGFDKYIEGAADIICLTDCIQKLRALEYRARYLTTDEGVKHRIETILSDEALNENEKLAAIEAACKDGKFMLSNFVVALNDYTNGLANKKSHADRSFEQDYGRKAFNVGKKFEGRVAANMIVGNISSAITNFAALTQGGAELNLGRLTASIAKTMTRKLAFGNSRLHRANCLQGILDAMRSVIKDDGITEISTFLINRRGSKAIVDNTWLESTSDVLSVPMEFVDSIVAESLVRGRYRQNLKQGMSHAAAMDDADAWVAGVMADRSKGSMPTVFNRMNPRTKAFTMFQLEVNNQFSWLFKDLPRRSKNGWVMLYRILKFFLLAYLFNDLFEILFGRRAQFDPLGIVNEASGDFFGVEVPNVVDLTIGAFSGDIPDFEVQKKDRWDAIVSTFTNIGQEVPFVGGWLGGGRYAVASSFIDLDKVGSALLSNDEELSLKKRGYDIASELISGGFYSAMPFAGGMLKKAIDGGIAVYQGGSYTVDKEGNDKLQYPIHDDGLVTYLRAMLLGKTTLPEGRGWIDNSFKGFSAKQTEVYKNMLEEGADSKASYDVIKEIAAVPDEGEGQEAKKRAILLESDVSGEGKFAAYKLMFTGEGESDLMERLERDGVDKGEAVKVLIGIKNTDDLRKSEKSNAQRAAIAESTLTDEQKKMIYRSRLSEDHDDRIEALEGVGLSFDDFLKVQSAYATFKDEQETATGQALEFSMWVDDNYSGKQASVIRENFKYFIQTPVDAGVYDDFAGAGVSKDAASKLRVAFDALEPENGRDEVSSLQQYRAILDCNLSETDTAAAMDEIMTSTDREKYSIAKKYGFSITEFVEFKELMEASNADGKGSVKKDEATEALKKLKISDQERAVLWALAGEWKNNPFDADLGERLNAQLYGER